MLEFEMGQRVTIKESGLRGRINAIHLAQGAEPQYRVLMYDSTGRPCEWYYYASDLEAAD